MFFINDDCFTDNVAKPYFQGEFKPTNLRNLSRMTRKPKKRFNRNYFRLFFELKKKLFKAFGRNEIERFFKSGKMKGIASYFE